MDSNKRADLVERLDLMVQYAKNLREMITEGQLTGDDGPLNEAKTKANGLVAGLEAALNWVSLDT